MKRSRQVFLIAAVLVLCAGVVVGRLSARLAIEPPPPPPGAPSWLADQLGLSAEQRQQMDAIWADTKRQLGSTWDKRHELDHERDEAIQNLLTSDQKVAYQKIYEDYRSKRQEQDKSRDALVKSAEERSRALLSDSQKTRWDQLSKGFHGPWQGHGPGHGPGPGHDASRDPNHDPGDNHGPGFGPTSRWSGGPGPDHGPPDAGP